MIQRIERHTIQDTVNGIYSLAMSSVGYAQSLNPPRDPVNLFYFLKSRTRYVNDAPGVEQVQRLQTLLGPDNIHGIPGAGDCDCFTAAVLACLAAVGYREAYIVLIGNSTAGPTHVYPAIDHMGSLYPLDLTASGPGVQRRGNSKGPYRAWQVITAYID